MSLNKYNSYELPCLGDYLSFTSLVFLGKIVKGILYSYAKQLFSLVLNSAWYRLYITKLSQEGASKEGKLCASPKWRNKEKKKNVGLEKSFQVIEETDDAGTEQR